MLPGRAFVTAIALGLLGGAAHLWITPVQVSAIALFIFAFVLTLTYPAGAWQWALLMGLSVPAFHGLIGMLVLRSPFRPEEIYPAAIALVPTFTGAYTAVFLRWRASKLNRRGDESP